MEANKQNLYEKLSAHLDFMSIAEYKIASSILTNPQIFITYSIAEAAGVARVSQGSINNFCQKYAGCGFAAMKLLLSSQLSEYRKSESGNIGQEDCFAGIFRQNIRDTSQAFQSTAELNQSETLIRVADRILCAKRIELYGVFHSGLAANSFCYELLQLGLPAVYVSDMLTCSVSATMLSPDSLVIAFSSSGKTKEIIDAVSLARHNQVGIISVTSNAYSPLAKLSDEVLISAASGNSSGRRSNEIRLSQLFLTDVICRYLRSQLDATGANKNKQVREILSSHNVQD